MDEPQVNAQKAIAREVEPEQTLHANYMAAHGGAFDVALDFGSRVDQDAVPESVLRIFMSYEHLKVMIPVLQQQLENYEGQLGEVPNLVQPEAS